MATRLRSSGVIVVVMGVVVGVEKMRLQFQDTVEIERLTLQNGVERHARLHGAMQRGVGIDAAKIGRAHV